MTRPDELGRKLSAAAQRPGLAVLATEDHYVGTDQMRRRAAERRVPESRCSRASVTGGWSKTRRAVPIYSPESGFLPR
jgi:hypothetical protein